MKHNIDAKRLLCPMPIIRLSEKINMVDSGDFIEIIATDLGVLHDIPAWCKVHGHKVIKIHQKNNQITLLIEKIG